MVASVREFNAADFDAPGALSIVVQGALFRGNMVETANHCRHWRELFPAAEIVLSLSVTDVVFGRLEGGVFRDVFLVPDHCHDGHLQAALAAIVESCDKIGLADGALPLPPIKSDTPKLNNMNLQIAAAKRGLMLVSGRFVLRIRSDMIFLDKGFLEQYCEAEGLPRGDSGVFGRRVLISWLYTLNPYTVERLPLHFSDWFHFGLVADVRRIWDVPPVSLKDAVHYRTHPHAAGSNSHERLFNTKIAVEQHLMFHCFRSEFDGLRLEYHNDRSSTELSLGILVDNFVICDLRLAGCVFDKYSGEFTDHAKEFHCLTREDWFAMVLARETPFSATLSHKVAEARGSGVQNVRGGPKRFAATRLRTNDGRLINGEMVAVSPDGVLFFGPYAALPAGRYVATVQTTTLEGPGSLTLKVTRDGGGKRLALKTIAVDSGGVGAGSTPDLSIEFDVPAPGATKVEVVCRIKGLRGISVSGITIAERPVRGGSVMHRVLHSFGVV